MTPPAPGPQLAQARQVQLPKGWAVVDVRKGQLNRYVAYDEAYATSHETFDHDKAVHMEMRNVSRALAESVALQRRGELKDIGADLKLPRAK